VQVEPMRTVLKAPGTKRLKTTNDEMLSIVAMTFKDKPTLENVITGQFNSRCPQFTCIFERGLVFECHIKLNLRQYTEGVRVRVKKRLNELEQSVYGVEWCRLTQ